MTKKEREQIRDKEALKISHDRGPTWNGIRPSVMENKAKDPAKSRRDAKKELKEYDFER